MEHRKVVNNRIGIAHMFWFYWSALVLWQNLGRETPRNGGDLVFKTGLIFLLTAFYLLRARWVSIHIFAVFLLAVSMAASLVLSGDALSGGSLIAYAYPVLLAFLSFGIGNDFQINKRELLFFLKGVILVTLYAALYALLFCTDQFITAFSHESAYGNELTSFFVSSHEYGMYLVYAIVACVICMEVEQKTVWKKIAYTAAILIFLPNLFLTFSRTSLLALAVAVLAYCLAGKWTPLRRVIVVAVVLFAAMVFFSSRLREFIVLLLFKGQEKIGIRGELYPFAVKLFWEGSCAQKLFGCGTGVRSVFEAAMNHGSVHNAYLQVLLYFGSVNLVFFVVLLISQLKENIRLYRHSKFFSVMFAACLLSAMALMFTNTTIVFTSPIDSFFLTAFTILVPKYVRNAIRAGAFEEKRAFNG